MVGMRGMGQREQHVDVQQVLHGDSASALSITDKATGFFPGARGRTSKPLTGSRTRPGNRASVVAFRRPVARRAPAGFLNLVSVVITERKASGARVTSPLTAQNKSSPLLTCQHLFPMITEAHTENRSFTLSELAGQDENAFERYLQEKDQFLDRLEIDAQ